METNRRVGAPDVHISIRNDLAGLVVDDLDDQRKLDASLVLGVVLADLLSLDV